MGSARTLAGGRRLEFACHYTIIDGLRELACTHACTHFATLLYESLDPAAARLSRCASPSPASARHAGRRARENLDHTLRGFCACLASRLAGQRWPSQSHVTIAAPVSHRDPFESGYSVYLEVHYMR